MTQKQPFIPSPAPREATLDELRNVKFGAPKSYYVYRNADESIATYIRRFEHPNGKKEFLPLTFGEGEYGPGFYCNHLLTDCPIFNLPAILANPEKTVLICEGEKTAEKAAQIFPEFVCTTSLGGAQSAEKSNWSVLKGRKIIFWMDNDKAGEKYVNSVFKLLAKEIAAACFIDLDDRFPISWDLGDELPADIKLDDLHSLIANATQCIYERDSDEVVLKIFLLSKDFVKVFDEDSWKILCGRLAVCRYVRSEAGDDWSLQLEFDDLDGNSHQIKIPRSLLITDTKELAKILSGKGLPIPSIQEKNPFKEIASYILAVNPAERVTSVDRIGWNDKSFVFPHSILGAQSLFFQPNGDVTKYEQKGTLRDWRESIGALAANNPYIEFFLCASFAPVILHPLDSENFGFNLYGCSSKGKTTILNLAASVWGHSICQWRNTLNGMEAIAANHCDSLICFDELSQADESSLDTAIYMLINGKGKGRASVDAYARKPAVWRSIILSTAEMTVGQKLLQGGKKSQAGQEVRIINIPLENQAYGAFNDLHGYTNGHVFSDTLKDLSHRFRGTAIVHFIEKIQRLDWEDLQVKFKEFSKTFVEEVTSSESSGQSKRVASHFALVAYAGQLAVDFEILPFTAPVSTIQTSKALYKLWLEARGSDTDLELKNGIEQVKNYFEKYGENRFTTTDDGSGAFARDRDRFNREIAGYKKVKDDETLFLVFPQTFVNEIAKGFDSKLLCKKFLELGVLIPGENGRFQKKERLPGARESRRVYCFNSKILTLDTI